MVVAVGEGESMSTFMYRRGCGLSLGAKSATWREGAGRRSRDSGAFISPPKSQRKKKG